MELLLILLGLLAAAAAAQLRLARRWRRRLDELIGSLRTAPAAAAVRDDLPSIIAAFARKAAPARQRPPSLVRLVQCAEMRFALNQPWRPLEAEERFATLHSAFVWTARMPLAPLLTVHVVDTFVAGDGLLEARLWQSLRIARAEGPEAAKGELMRYLAELAWVPDAILFNHELRWSAIDERTIEVSAASSGGLARVRLRFDEHGDIVGAEADDRPREVKGRSVPSRWSGRFWDYRDFDGYRIPARGEVSWVLDEGEFAYWRGEIVNLSPEN